METCQQQLTKCLSILKECKALRTLQKNHVNAIYQRDLTRSTVLKTQVSLQERKVDEMLGGV